MKRIAYYLTVLALAVFTFTSCEDVPSPFGQIVAPKTDDVVVVEPSGTGTQADPFNVAGVIEYLGGLGADVPSPNEVYIVGYITSITETFGTQYGNATFGFTRGWKQVPLLSCALSGQPEVQRSVSHEHQGGRQGGYLR